MRQRGTKTETVSERQTIKKERRNMKTGSTERHRFNLQWPLKEKRQSGRGRRKRDRKRQSDLGSSLLPKRGRDNSYFTICIFV